MARIFTLLSPLGESGKFAELSGREEISKPFDFTLTIASLDNSIAMNAILGQAVTIDVQREDNSHRYFNGFVTEFRQIRRHGKYFHYEARLRPQLWFLSQTRDFKIFQKSNARDIVKQVLSEFGIAIKDKLNGYYRPREYTVCYGESYFDFCSRLMEEEGISYYFEHANGSHTLVLCDSISAYPTLPSHASIPYYPPDMAGIPTEEYVSYWSIAQTINPGKHVTEAYDFKKPKANLRVIQPKPRSHPHNSYEIFDFPGGYREVGDGENYARLHIESMQVQHERADAETNVRGIMSGYRTSLRNCPRKAENREYLIVAAEHHWIDNSYETGQTAKTAEHQTRFIAQPSSEAFRPERTAPYPVANATEIAVVTGPAGQEIWTDEHGRIKLHFPWDRHGPKDENSSCWVRVATTHAGSSFGAVSIPRIGEEVLVSYINGDPDHPLVTGRVYNADNMPPWKLPGNATQSGILTRSSKGGGYDNANAIRFEDKKGEEQLWLHAEKDQLTEVEHDEDKWVGNDRRKTIDHDETNHIKHDRTETVDNDETITVHGKRTEVVDGNEDITIHSNRTERVDQNEKISIGQNRDEDVGASETVKIANNRSKKIGNDEDISIGSSLSIDIGTKRSETIGMMAMQNVGMMKMSNTGMVRSTNTGVAHNDLVGVSSSAQVGKTKTVNVGDNYSISTKVFKIEAADMIELCCGSSKIVLTPAGIFQEALDINMIGQNTLSAESKLVNINTGAAKPAPNAPKADGGGGSGAGGAGAGAPGGAPGSSAGGLGGLGDIASAAGKIAQAARGGLGGLAGMATGGLGGLGGMGKGGAAAGGPASAAGPIYM